MQRPDPERCRKHLWLIPAWQRVEETERLLESLGRYDPEAFAVLFVHTADPFYDELATLADKYNLYLLSQDTQTVTQKMNSVFDYFTSMETYGLLANDVELRTEGALKALEDACPEWGLSYCDDSIQGKSLATHPCVSGKLLKALGWWALPGLKHSFVDNVLMDYATALGKCVYLPEHTFFHYHPSARRSLEDAGHMLVQDWYIQDFKTYQEFKATEYDHRMHLVLEAMKWEEKTQKDLEETLKGGIEGCGI